MGAILLQVARVNDDPFADWKVLVNRPVFSSDRKKLGFIRKVLADHIVVKRGLISLSNYAIPKTLAESVDKKGVRLRITAHEALQYSSAEIKHSAAGGRLRPAARERAVYDRLLTFRYGTTRNRLAAGIAFISGTLFLLSGYRANIEIYRLITDQLVVHTVREFWVYAIVPIGILALLSQLGGFTVLMGAGLFAANRVNIGKFLVMVGTGQGLITILLRILQEIWTGRWTLDNNFVTWLTSTATGLGILFAIVAQSISKGKGESVAQRVARRLWRRSKQD